MAKVTANLTIDGEVMKDVEKMAKVELNGNEISKSRMAEILFVEAIAARKAKKAKTSK